MNRCTSLQYDYLQAIILPSKVAVLVLVLFFKASPVITDSLPLEWVITPARPLMWLWIRLVHCIFVGNLIPTFTGLHS